MGHSLHGQDDGFLPCSSPSHLSSRLQMTASAPTDECTVTSDNEVDVQTAIYSSCFSGPMCIWVYIYVGMMVVIQFLRVECTILCSHRFIESIQSQ
jgi:hypothetical protein